VADYIPTSDKRFLTPDAPPSGVFCRNLQVPDDPQWVGLVDGALSLLTSPDQWREYGALTAQQAADLWTDMLVTSWDVFGCPTEDLSPFWDDTDGGDAEGNPAESTYTYSDQITDWVIAAFVASSGAVGAAVSYLTIAPRFRLAFRTRDYGGIAEILIDDVLFSTIDTYSATPGVAFLDVIIG
jgi:hypothetical protein